MKQHPGTISRLSRADNRLRGSSCKIILLLATGTFLSGCSMGEEIKRIEAAQEAAEQRDASRSTNLTGEQLFIRSCNVCHPGGKAGVGPSLIDLETKFPTDEPLKKLIRKGVKNMPPQPETSINAEELDHLVRHLRVLAARLNEESK